MIVGGESGPRARPFDVAWAHSVVAQCRGSGVPAFVKQLGANVRDRNDVGFDAESEATLDEASGEWRHDPMAWPEPRRVEHDPNGYREEHQGAPVRVHLCDPKGGDPSEWPEDLRVREYPELAEGSCA